MSRIDLIPAFWRDRYRVRRALKAFAMALLVTLLLMGAFRSYLAWQGMQARQAMARMNDEKAALDQALDSNQREFNRLQSLRDKTARMKLHQSLSVVDKVLVPLDAALVEGVTLGEMSIQLAELPPDAKLSASLPPGTETARVLLQGESTSAAGLTQMAERLAATPDWKNLKMGKQSPRPDGNGLEFSLEADVNLLRKKSGAK